MSTTDITSAFGALNPQVPTDKEAEKFEDMSRWHKFLDIISRPTQASASVANNLAFEEDVDPLKAFVKGIAGRGEVKNFGDFTEKAGWKPDSKGEKALKGIVDFGLDVGLSPDTYLSFGAAPVTTKLLPKAGMLIKAGGTAGGIAKVAGEGVGKAAKVIEAAREIRDPRAQEVVAKLLKGEAITKTEEAVIDARTLVGLQNLGVFGNDDVLKLIPKDWTVKFFDEADKMGKVLEKAPVISPIVNGFGKAFSQYHDLKKKFPTLFQHRKNRDAKVYAATAQGLHRAMSVMDLVADPEERKLITQLMENPDESIVTGSYFKDVTKLINQNTHVWADMGFKPGQQLSDDDAVELVSHYFNSVNDWVSEYGPDGIFSTKKLQGEIEGLEQMLAQRKDFLDAAEGLKKNPALKEEELLRLNEDALDAEALVKDMDALLKRKRAELQKSFGPIVDGLDKYNVGKGHFGQVKGRFDLMKFQNKVIKLPLELGPESFESLLREDQAYKALHGIPGVGTSKMVWREIPLNAEGGKVAKALFKGASSVGEATEGLMRAKGFIVRKSDGTEVLRVPNLVKNLVDVDQESTKAFHGFGGNPHWRMPTKGIRSFEKLLARASRAGVSLADLHSGNLVLDKKNQAHILDLGFGVHTDKSPEGIRNAWANNLDWFTRFVVFSTKYGTGEIKDLASKVKIKDTAAQTALLQKAGLPTRYLSEEGATKPLTEGFAKLPTGSKPFKITQRELVEERVPLVSKLSPQGREAYEQVQLWKKSLTEKLIDTGLLTEEWIESFEEKFGLQHLRHLKTQEGLIRRFQNAVQQAITKGSQPGTLKARKIEGSIKAINDRMGRDFFDTDIARIMFASDVEVHSAVENWKYLQTIADNADFSRPAKEVFRVIKNKDGSKKRVRQFVAEEGYEIVHHPLFEGKMVPSEIAADIQNIVRKGREDLGHQAIKKYYDPVHNWLRSYSLFLFPSYFIRNIGGGVWNNFLADVRPTAYAKAHDILWGGKPIKQTFGEFSKGVPFHADGIRSPRPDKKLESLGMTYQEILDEMNEYGVLGKGQYSASGEIEQEFGASLGKIKASQLLDPSTKNAMLQFGQRVGNQTEHVLRAAHYIDKRAKGLGPAEAAQSVKKFQFDYSDLTDFEKNWMKRAFFFYPFTRKNVPLQTQMFLLRPGKFTAVGKGVNEFEDKYGGPDPGDKMLPEWIHKQLGVRVRYDKEKKTYQYFLLGGWIPAADLDKYFRPVDTATDMMTPLMRVPLELMTNKSFFFDRALEDYPGQAKELLSPEAGKQVGLDEGLTTTGKLNHVLRSFRPINETRRVLEAAAKGGPSNALMQTALGKLYDVNPESQKGYRDRELKYQLQHLKSEMKQAQGRGKAGEVERLKKRIIALQKEF